MSQTCLTHGSLWGMGMYCTKCGAPTVEQKTVTCPSGHVVSVHDLYCPECGKQIAP